MSAMPAAFDSGSQGSEMLTGSGQDVEQPTLELTILMPCLNEAETLGTCIDKARTFLQRKAIVGEILVADNGSTDGSLDIAARHGARVARISTRGYGATL